MVKKNKNISCCGPSGSEMSCCKVESLVSVDVRGQMVLPKELRDKANIRPGDKLALVSWEKHGRICCFTLIKAEDFAEMVKGVIGPMIGEVIKK